MPSHIRGERLLHPVFCLNDPRLAEHESIHFAHRSDFLRRDLGLLEHERIAID